LNYSKSTRIPESPRKNSAKNIRHTHGENLPKIFFGSEVSNLQNKKQPVFLSQEFNTPSESGGVSKEGQVNKRSRFGLLKNYESNAEYESSLSSQNKIENIISDSAEEKIKSKPQSLLKIRDNGISSGSEASGSGNSKNIAKRVRFKDLPLRTHSEMIFAREYKAFAKFVNQPLRVYRSNLIALLFEKDDAKSIDSLLNITGLCSQKIFYHKKQKITLDSWAEKMVVPRLKSLVKCWILMYSLPIISVLYLPTQIVSFWFLKVALVLIFLVLKVFRIFQEIFIAKNWGDFSGHKIASYLFSIENVSSILIFIVISISVGNIVILTISALTSTAKISQRLNHQSYIRRDKNTISDSNTLNSEQQVERFLRTISECRYN
jgi:hypothetical protein